MENASDLPPGRPSVITRVLGVDNGWLRVGQARRARVTEQAGGPLRFCVWVGVPGGFAGMNRWRAKLLSKQTLVPCVAGILFILYTQKIN
jgi:hypothetical protein